MDVSLLSLPSCVSPTPPFHFSQVPNVQADERQSNRGSGTLLFVVDFSRVTRTRPLLSGAGFIPARQVVGRDRRKCC